MESFESFLSSPMTQTICTHLLFTIKKKSTSVAIFCRLVKSSNKCWCKQCFLPIVCLVWNGIFCTWLEYRNIECDVKVSSNCYLWTCDVMWCDVLPDVNKSIGLNDDAYFLNELSKHSENLFIFSFLTEHSRKIGYFYPENTIKHRTFSKEKRICMQFEKHVDSSRSHCQKHGDSYIKQPVSHRSTSNYRKVFEKERSEQFLKRIVCV